jgi:soluble lytic murein transglycosylase-like protein
MPHFYKAEDMYHLPTNILYGIAEAESGFRPEVINCEIVSSKGAKGLMQILPKFHPDAKPCDPVHSIYYAARYLFWIKDTLNTNNWAMIIGSYHWGLNNAKSKKPKDYPEPVKDYVLFVLNEIHWKLWLMGERP